MPLILSSTHIYLSSFHSLTMAFNHFFSYARSLLILVVMVATASAKPEYEKPELEKNLLSTIVGIQGLVYCKSGPKVIPLEGINFLLVETSLALIIYCCNFKIFSFSRRSPYASLV